MTSDVNTSVKSIFKGEKKLFHNYLQYLLIVEGDSTLRLPMRHTCPTLKYRGILITRKTKVIHLGTDNLMAYGVILSLCKDGGALEWSHPLQIATFHWSPKTQSTLVFKNNGGMKGLN